MGGMVLETNISEVVTQVEQQNKVEKSETSPTMTLKVPPLLHTQHSLGLTVCERER